MKPVFPGANFGLVPTLHQSVQTSAKARKPLTTRFGELVDVRNRGALRVGRFAGSQALAQDAPAVVRLWAGDQCREMSTEQARALASQLLTAASLAELQNNH